MEKSRRLFFQILLLVLAIVFTFAIRYVYENQSARTGTFGEGEKVSNVTVSDVFSAFCAGGEV